MGKLVPLGISAFVYLVGIVVALRSKEKMFWIYANGVVASMQNMKIFRYLTEVNSPREAVCEVNATNRNMCFKSPVGV